MKYLLLLLFGWVSVSAQQDGLSVIVNGDTATIWNTNIVQNCGFAAMFDVKQNGTTLTITEIDTTKVYMRCHCTFTLSVSISGLANDTYTANVYRRHTLENLHPESTYVVGTIQFTIGGATGVLAYTGFQSPCQGPVDVISSPPVPLRLTLQGYPNPFNPSITLSYSLSTKGSTQLFMRDLLGRTIATLINGIVDAGPHVADWNADGMKSGLYFCTLRTENEEKTIKVILLR
jgi:hypothetical protein